MNELQEIVRIAGTALEFFGVFIIVLGSTVATGWFFYNIRRVNLANAYREYRRIFGRFLILGLDFLIAGDIIRTVIVAHTVTNVVVLGLIVLVRAFLSVTLELGTEGSLPWTRVQSANRENPS